MGVRAKKNKENVKKNSLVCRDLTQCTLTFAPFYNQNSINPIKISLTMAYKNEETDYIEEVLIPMMEEHSNSDMNEKR